MGKGIAALAKIRKRTKQLQKKHPGKKYATLRTQAKNEYNAGTIPKARKKPAKSKSKRKPAKQKVSKVGSHYKVYHEVKKVGKRKKRATRKRAAPKRTKSRARVRVVHRTVTRTRRVGGMGKSIMPLLAVAALGVGAYLLLKPKTTAAPPLVPTGNTTRDTSAQNILAYAQAAGLGIAAITNLINSLNNMSDAAVVQAAARPDLSINTLAAVPTGGPSINLGY
jgi:hypothetical protein